MNLFNCFVLALFSLGAVLVSAHNYNIDEVYANIGQSYGLNFDYHGPKNVRYYLTKDARYFRADRRRVFQRLGRIYFSKITQSDAGVYRMVVKGTRIYSQAIKLIGKHTSIAIDM